LRVRVNLNRREPLIEIGDRHAASRRYYAQVINPPVMRLGFDLSYPFARHGELSSARDTK
jgi:hypothetical protein